MHMYILVTCICNIMSIYSAYCMEENPTTIQQLQTTHGTPTQNTCASLLEHANRLFCSTQHAAPSYSAILSIASLSLSSTIFSSMNHNTPLYALPALSALGAFFCGVGLASGTFSGYSIYQNCKTSSEQTLLSENSEV